MSQEERHDLDLTMLLQLLQNRQEPYTLKTTLRRGISTIRFKGPCELVIRAVHGNITECMLLNERQKISGLELVQYLPRNEMLTWTLVVEEKPAVADKPAVQAQNTAPPKPLLPDTTFDKSQPLRRLPAANHPETLATLPRILRQVLALVDGKRSALDIERILHIPLEQLREILQHLKKNNFIG